MKDVGIRTGRPGSSPLARGLRAHGGVGCFARGIIPARAGFTSSSPVLAVFVRGSSPLARGLRASIPLAVARARIIPARAGFTVHNARQRFCGRDHPRSRGVYRAIGVDIHSEIGSSPLARGLRASAVTSNVTSRIIPARAGFTIGSDDAPESVTDHPRSRGVYHSTITSSPYLLGSSPLARGLLNEIWVVNAHGGIIPARAGFTPRLPGWRRELWDHPRSRGVYIGVRVVLLQAVGSSPLARGLPELIRERESEIRIIPARAGFTGRAPCCAPTPTDHPRSRGVYRADGDARHAHTGSSPLARGLPAVDRLIEDRAGIIPARAGFTGGGHGGDLGGGDHPRSRGVY